MAAFTGRQSNDIMRSTTLTAICKNGSLSRLGSGCHFQTIGIYETRLAYNRKQPGHVASLPPAAKSIEMVFLQL